MIVKCVKCGNKINKERDRSVCSNCGCNIKSFLSQKQCFVFPLKTSEKNMFVNINSYEAKKKTNDSHKTSNISIDISKDAEEQSLKNEENVIEKNADDTYNSGSQTTEGIISLGKQENTVFVSSLENSASDMRTLFDPKIILTVVFLVTEIIVSIYLLSSNVVNNALDQSLGTFLALQIGIIVHSFVGCLMCRIAHKSTLSYLSSVVSSIVAGYSFIYAIRDLSSIGGLEGAFTWIIGLFFFGAIALGVIALCFKMPSWMCSVE